jgi:hypothetical protein
MKEAPGIQPLLFFLAGRLACCLKKMITGKLCLLISQWNKFHPENSTGYRSSNSDQHLRSKPKG